MINAIEWKNMSHMDRMSYLNCKPVPLPPLTDLCIDKWKEEHFGNGSECCIFDEVLIND